MPLSDSVNVVPLSLRAALRTEDDSGMVTASSYLFMVARFMQSLPPENQASSVNSRATLAPWATR